MSLLQMSFSGAIMILAIVLVRALAVNRLPKRAFLILWELVLLRLLVPFSIPSVLSAYSIINRSMPIQKAIPEAPIRNMNPQTAAAPVEIYEGVSQGLQNEGTDISIWLIIWLIGMFVCAGYFLFAYLRCRREFQMSLLVQNEFVSEWLKAHPLKRTIRIRQSDRISAPLTYGVFRPVILMPKKTDWENQHQLQYVLVHEYIHIRRLDTVYKLIATLALCMHWFNPFVWVMYILYNRDIELACDEGVVHQFGDGAKATYARTLITMEETRSGLTPLCNNFSKNAIEERITAIMKTQKLTVGLIAISVAIIIAIMVLFATSAQSEAASEQSETGIVMENVEVSSMVLEAAKELVGRKYADMQELYNNWRIKSLTNVYTYEDFDGMTLQIYQMNYEFLANDPENIVLAGGMDMDEEGWVVPEYANSTYLIFQQEGEIVTYLTTLAEMDGFPGDEVFTDDLRLQLGNAKIVDEGTADTVRENTMVIQCMVEGILEEIPASLYVGDGFSIYIPDEDWNIYDENLEAPAEMTAEWSSEVRIWVEHYEDESFFDVEERLVSEGYAYDTSLRKLKKLEDNLLTEARLAVHENDVWAVFSMHNAAYELGSRLDAIAETFAIAGSAGDSSKEETVSAENGEVSQILKDIMVSFYTAYFDSEGDAEKIKPYLSETFAYNVDLYHEIEPNSTIYSAGDLDVKGIKTQAYEINGTVGDTCVLSLEFCFPNEDSLTYLTVEFVREDAGWKIAFYGLEK